MSENQRNRQSQGQDTVIKTGQKKESQGSHNLDQ